MACFLVPTAEAIVTTVASKSINKHLEGKENVNELAHHYAKNMKTLNGLLWGGSALLMFEHVWHGEMVPFFPFFTAASNPSDLAAMLHEMSTVGVMMAFLVTLVWAIATFITFKIAHPSSEKTENKTSIEDHGKKMGEASL